MKKWIACIFALLTGIGFAQQEVLHKALQESFAKFQHLEPRKADDGFPALQTITLNEKPVIVEGKRYDGFSFTARRGGEDPTQQSLVWGFCQPPNVESFFIAPEAGTMDGFTHFHHFLKDRMPRFKQAEPKAYARIIVQSLDGGRLVEGKKYLIYFAFRDDKPATFTASFGFTDLADEDAATLARALGADKVVAPAAAPAPAPPPAPAEKKKAK